MRTPVSATDITVFALRAWILSTGHLREHGSGAELLEIEDGIFANLVSETGPTQAPRLRQIAHDTAAKRAVERQA
jgi:hypothetical protein